MTTGNVLTCKLVIDGGVLILTLLKIRCPLKMGFVTLIEGPRKRAGHYCFYHSPATISGTHTGRDDKEGRSLVTTN